MNKPISRQIGSALAHIQDLMDTIFHITFKRVKSRSEKGPRSAGILRFFSDAGDSFYEKYTELKQKRSKKNE
ncbi:MAG: hypothetical protein V3U16_06635 [Candidatus Neomarinimicrobiota bacterium]